MMHRPRLDPNGARPEQEDGKAQAVAFAFEPEDSERFNTDPEALRRSLGQACGQLLDETEVEHEGGTFTVRGTNHTVHTPSRLLFEIWWRSLKAARHNHRIGGDISWAAGEVLEDETESTGRLAKLLG